MSLLIECFFLYLMTLYRLPGVAWSSNIHLRIFKDVEEKNDYGTETSVT
jgi:hypothetical protein